MKINILKFNNLIIGLFSEWNSCHRAKECRTRMWHEVAKRLVVKFGGNHLYLVTRPDYCGDRDWNTGDGEITEIWR